MKIDKNTTLGEWARTCRVIGAEDPFAAASNHCVSCPCSVFCCLPPDVWVHEVHEVPEAEPAKTAAAAQEKGITAEDKLALIRAVCMGLVEDGRSPEAEAVCSAILAIAAFEKE